MICRPGRPTISPRHSTFSDMWGGEYSGYRRECAGRPTTPRRAPAHRASVHLRPGGLKAVAAADGRDHQVQRRMLRMPAFVQQLFRRFLGDADLGQFLFLRMTLAEVGAQAALTYV